MYTRLIYDLIVLHARVDNWTWWYISLNVTNSAFIYHNSTLTVYSGQILRSQRMHKFFFKKSLDPWAFSLGRESHIKCTITSLFGVFRKRKRRRKRKVKKRKKDTPTMSSRLIIETDYSYYFIPTLSISLSDWECVQK